MSMDYHGGNKNEIFAERSFNSYILGILGNSLFFKHRFSPNVFEVELLNMTLSQLTITADNMDRVLVIDKSRQPEGKFQMSNTEI